MCIKVKLFVLVVGAFAVAGCSSGELASTNSSTSSNSSNSSSPSSTESAEVFADVDPKSFLTEFGHHRFKYSPGSKFVSECYFSHTAVGCYGTPASDVPDITAPPFKPTRPGGVVLTSEGLQYLLMEDIPLAETELKPGERIRYGSIICQFSSQLSLTCSNRKHSFSISGPDLNITTTTTGTIITPPSETPKPQQ